MLNPIIDDIKAKVKDGNPVTRLIIINVAVFLIVSITRLIFYFAGGQISIDSIVTSILSFPLSPQKFILKPWTIITYMFTHFDLFHLLFNMVILYWFSEIVASFTSSKKIIPLYLLGGIAGGVFTLLLFLFIPGLDATSKTIVGGSAGVAALAVAAATLAPNFKINLLLIGPVKLVYVVAFVLLIDFLKVESFSNGGNLSHLGGALLGYFFITQYKKGKDYSQGVNRFFEGIQRLTKISSKRKLKVAHKRPVSDEEYNYNRKMNQQEIDRILDKISKSGYESLSKSEKEILFKASK